MTITTAPATWDPEVAKADTSVVTVELALLWRTGAAPTARRDPHVERICAGEPLRPDPSARSRMAELIYEITGWTMVIPDFSADRAYVSRLWAEDWNSPEDAVYDE